MYKYRIIVTFCLWRSYYIPYVIDLMTLRGSGADIGWLKAQGIPLIGFRPDHRRYFEYHHTNEDTFDTVNQQEPEPGKAAMYFLFYFILKYGW
ncbi:MAG: hypothetical protein KFF73_04910 [Cyclobacteriaceae bacterium]|nr:hypothetical protein [Cyclobacteriaceae bacterium]